MAQDFTTDVTKWQGVDDEPVAYSDNLVKSGGVKNSLNQVEQRLTPLDGQFDIDFVQGGFTVSDSPKTCVENNSSFWIRSNYQEISTIKYNSVSVNSGYSFKSYYFDVNKTFLGTQNGYNPAGLYTANKYVRFAINNVNGITPQDNHGFTFESNIKSVNRKITELEESVQQDIQEVSNDVETVTAIVNNVISPKVNKNSTDIASLDVRVDDYDGGEFSFGWEQGGYYNEAVGYKEKRDTTARIRTSTYLDWKRIKSFSINIDGGFSFNCYFYDENYRYLSTKKNTIVPSSDTARTVYVTISITNTNGITPTTDFGLQYELYPRGFKKEFFDFKSDYNLYNDGQNSIVRFTQRNNTSLISNYIPHNVIYDVSVNSGYSIYIITYNRNLEIIQSEVILSSRNIKSYNFTFCKLVIKKQDGSAITTGDSYGFTFKTFLDYINEIHDRNVIENTKFQHGIIQACLGSTIDSSLHYESRFNAIYIADLHGRFGALDDAGSFKRFFSNDNLNIFNAGDIVSGTPKVNGIVSTDIADYMTKAIANCVYHCMGQHEVGFAYSYSNVKDQCLTHEETFNLLIAPIKETWGLPNLDTIYYYKDFSTQKIRLISLYQYNAPIIEHPTDSTKYKYPRGIVWHGQAQLEWLCATLNSVPDDYGVIIMMHQNEKSIVNTYQNQFFTGNRVNSANCVASESPIYDIVDAYIKRQTLSKTYTASNQSAYLISDGFTESVNANFSNARGTFLNYLTGDTHIDSIGTIDTFGHPNLGITASGTSADVVMRTLNYGGRTASAGENPSSTLLTFVGYSFTNRLIRIGRIGQQFASNGQIRMLTSIPFFNV